MMKRIITVVVIMVILIPTLLIGCAVNYYIQHTMRDEALVSLSSIAHMLEEQINKSYDRLISDIQMKAENDTLRSVLEGAGVSGSTSSGEFGAAMEILLHSKGFPVTDGAVINTDGKIILSSQLKEEGQMLNMTELYQDIIFGNTIYARLVIMEDNTYIVEIGVPIRDSQNKIIGILKQSVDVTLLSEYLGSVGLGDSGEAFLIIDNGYMISDKDSDHGTIFYNEYQDRNSLGQLIMDYKMGRKIEDQGIVEFSSKGVSYVGSYEKIDAISSIAVFSIRQDEIYGGLAELKSFLSFISLILIIIIIAGCYIAIYFHITPLRKINDTLKKIAHGDMTARCSVNRKNEYEELSRNINYLADSFQKNERELRMSSRIDHLTHLPNQNAMYELLDTLLYKHKNQAMLLLELEGFKTVNEHLGYEVGDRILMEIGEILRELPQYVCYSSRLGGAEFLVFITKWTSSKYPEKIAENIIKKIEEIRFIDEVRVNVTANIGIVYMNSEKTDKRKLIKYSNAALRKAKSIGRNVYFVHYANLVND